MARANQLRENIKEQYRNVRANVAIVMASALWLSVGAFLDRSQTTVDDIGFMGSMIPHHSMAITRSRAVPDFQRSAERQCPTG